MVTDPLAQAIESAMLDCGSVHPHDVCTLGQLPNESRPEWLARLQARFEAFPLPGRQPDARRPLPRAEPLSLLVDCTRCGEPRWNGKACQACRMATRLRRRLA